MFGYDRSELVGQPLEILLPERYRSGHVGHRTSYFQEPKLRTMGAGMDLIGLRKDGSEFPVEVGLSGLTTEDGIRAMGAISDITDRKRAERDLAHVAGELRRSNSELEQFTYVASHDLQEPLRMVTNYLQLVERRYGSKLDADGLEFVHYAVNGASRMKALIEDLLRMSRAGTQAMNFTPVSAQVLADAAIQNLQIAIQESAAVVTTDPLPPVVADPTLLTQVFQNLIGNAIKFRAPGVQAQVHITANEREDEWVFSVRDNGLGIEPRHKERIFGIFERLHSADQYPGSGVGLAISQRVVERHGGRIWIESAPGEGSTFYFSIPVQVVHQKAAAD
jgi:PAS domain S-box-containing protein